MGFVASRIPDLCFAPAHAWTAISTPGPDNPWNAPNTRLQYPAEKILRMDFRVQTKFNSP
jgi:hypothetical protein